MAACPGFIRSSSRMWGCGGGSSMVEMVECYEGISATDWEQVSGREIRSRTLTA